MKTTRCKRRQFLQNATSALGALTFALNLPSAAAAEPASALDAKAKAQLDQILKDLEPSGKGYLAIPPKDGQFLNLLVKIARAKNVLEIGTSIGTSAIWLALALEQTGGKLTTLEILEDRVQKAKENVTKAGLAHRVTFKQGDAHQIVPTLKGPFDMVLLAADKEGMVDYFNQLYPKKLAPGALLLAPNAIRLREPQQAYLDLIGRHPDFETILLSATLDDGFAVSYRLRK